MHYEINIGLNGRHFFATHERSIQNLTTLAKVMAILNEKFTAEEGYTISVTRWINCGVSISGDEIKASFTVDQLNELFKK